MLNDLYSIVMAPLLRAFLVMLGATTGVWIRFEKVRGDFFSYKIQLDGFFLQISEHLSCTADICTLEFSLLDISLDTLIVSNVYLEGARFEYNHVSSEDMLPNSLPNFLIRNLKINNGVVVFNDQTRQTPATLHFYLDDYRCEALHSHWLIFNTIFTSQCMGSIEESPFIVSYAEEGETCVSQWRISGLPTKVLTPFMGEKLALIKESSMDLMVTNQWLVEEEEITMTFQVLISELVNLELPEFLPVTTKMFADALSVLFNSQVKELPIAFQFKVRKDDFMDLLGLDTTAIMTAFAEALVKAIMDKSVENTSHIVDMGMLGLGTLFDIKNLFDKY